MKPDDPRRLTGSVDIDTPLTVTQPNANRWDYAVAFQHTNRNSEHVYWIETHTANLKELNVVLAKLSWLRAWLAGEGKELNRFYRDFVWISSGTTTLSAPQLKRLVQAGLRQTGRILRIPDEL